eukprot:sb/3465336/
MFLAWGELGEIGYYIGVCCRSSIQGRREREREREIEREGERERERERERETSREREREREKEREREREREKEREREREREKEREREREREKEREREREREKERERERERERVREKRRERKKGERDIEIERVRERERECERDGRERDKPWYLLRLHVIKSSHTLHHPTRNRPKQVNNQYNQNSLFRSCDWLSTNQGPVFPDSVVTYRKSKQPIRTRYLGHVTGYRPIRNQYFLIRSVPVYILTKKYGFRSMGSCQDRSLFFITLHTTLFLSLTLHLTLSPSHSISYFHCSTINSNRGEFPKQQPTETSKQPIRTRYLGHVTGYHPIRDQYFLTRVCTIRKSEIDTRILFFITLHTTLFLSLTLHLTLSPSHSISYFHCSTINSNRNRPKQVNNQSELAIKVT